VQQQPSHVTRFRIHRFQTERLMKEKVAEQEVTMCVTGPEENERTYLLQMGQDLKSLFLRPRNKAILLN